MFFFHLFSLVSRRKETFSRLSDWKGVSEVKRRQRRQRRQPRQRRRLVVENS